MSPSRRSEVDDAARRVLEASWVEPFGFCMPNPRKYPYQWLWDSCFHAIAWSGLRDPRALRELTSLFALQLPSGFMPNMGYQQRPRRSTIMWDSRGRSDITQPPMYGHALRLMSERGYDVGELLAPARRGFEYLFRERIDAATGLIRIIHPWESGADDSPRWDSWGHPEGFRRSRWNRIKLRLLLHVRMRDGAAVENPLFDVCSIGFNALTAFNARELAAVTGDTELAARADTLVAAIEKRWSVDRQTWIDADATTGQPRLSSMARTLDALLPVLVSSDRTHVDRAFAQITSDTAFWHRFGPACTHRDEATFDPNTYWRGDVWPQLIYLLMVAAERAGRPEARLLAESLTAGALRSGMAERWQPDTGQGLGAAPQSWTAVAVEAARVLESRRPDLGLAG